MRTMQAFFCVVVMMVCIPMQAISDTEPFYNSIESLDIERLKKLLEQIKSQNETVQERTNFLQQLADFSDKKVEALEQHMYVTADWKDISHVCAGSLGLVISLIGVWFFNQKIQEVEDGNERARVARQRDELLYGPGFNRLVSQSSTLYVLGICGMGVMAACSLYGLSRGLHCNAQTVKIKKAQEIWECINSELGMLSLDNQDITQNN